MVSRFGRDRPAATRATAGDVFLAVSRDPWAKEQLGEIYRKLFEGQGVRQGSSPDHFIYVTPSKARANISELSGWVHDRYGDPSTTVPAKTPFGYISGPWDGWLTYFSALAFGTDRGGLTADFTESVARLPWSAPSTSRAVTAGAAPVTAPSTPSPPPPPPPSPTPTPPPPTTVEGAAAEPEAEKPGLLRRIFGPKPPPPPPPSPASAAMGEAWTEEESRESPEYLARRGREAENEDLERRLNEAYEAKAERYRAGGRPTEISEAEAVEGVTETKSKRKSRAKRSVGEVVSKSDIEATLKAMEVVRAVDEGAPAVEESTVEKLRRPEGMSTKSF